MPRVADNTPPKAAAGARTPGLLLHDPRRYDFMVWLALGGRERRYREKVLDLSRLAPGETMLDVGCGTGSLTVAARRRIGGDGAIRAVDASPEMLAAAQKKARKAGAEVAFQLAAAQALPFPDSQFDLVTATLMLHHLPRKTREEAAREFVRVLKPGGRVLAVDFAESGPSHRGFLRRSHRHGHVKGEDLAGLFERAGLRLSERGEVGVGGQHYVLAHRPSAHS